MKQLLLFDEPFEKKTDRKIEELIDKYEKIRKGQYSKITALEKRIKDLERELEFLTSKICKGNYLL